MAKDAKQEKRRKAGTKAAFPLLTSCYHDFNILLTILNFTAHLSVKVFLTTTKDVLQCRPSSRRRVGTDQSNFWQSLSGSDYIEDSYSITLDQICVPAIYIVAKSW